jgi:hypothetical protein
VGSGIAGSVGHRVVAIFGSLTWSHHGDVKFA